MLGTLLFILNGQARGGQANPPADISRVSAGGFHTCVLNGVSTHVQCWGRNEFGQLGDGTGQQRDRPVNVPGVEGGAVKCWGWNAGGQLGDGTTIDRGTPVGLDTDRDGCSDDQELGTDQSKGGRRSPKSFWDFMDQYTGSPMARDRVVSIGDIGAVVARNGTSGDPNGDPLIVPTSTNGYHTIADRNGGIPGGDPWDLQPPDGIISVGDIGAVVAQNGHSCA
ncbi:MAG: flexitail domain-containing putative surface protein [Dehalococcoidia bacterium]